MVMCRGTETLVERGMNGERQQLAVRHLGLARRVADEMLRSFSTTRADLDDLVCEAYLALSQAAERHDPRLGEFEPFAAMAIRRRCLNKLRAESRDRVRFQPIAVADGPPPSSRAETHRSRSAVPLDPKLDPDAARDRLHDLEALDRLKEWIARLGTRQQLVIRLRLEHWTDREISGKLKVTEDRVRQIADRALEALRQCAAG